MKKILITNAFGPQNRGDHELLSRLLQLINIAYSENISVEIFTSNPKESQAEFGKYKSEKSPFYKPKSFKALAKMLWDFPVWILAAYFPFFRVVLSKERRGKFLSYQDADLILMCPGGYIYSNGLSLYVNLVNLLPLKASQAKKMASPMSIGPFDNSLDIFCSKFILSRLDYIYVRESYSHKLVNEMGLNAIFCHDLAWITDKNNDSNEIDFSWKGHFVGTVIDWNFPGKDKAVLRERFIVEYLNAVSILVAESKRSFILYNQVGNGDGTSLDEKLIIELVERSEGKIVFDSNAMSPTLLKNKLRNANGVIASRFHSALFSIQVLCPFCSIAYQPKAEYILKDLQLDNLCFHIETFIGEEIALKLLDLHSKRDEFVAKLTKAQSTTISSIESVFLKKLMEIK